MPVVALRHLARDLAVVRLPRIPQAVVAGERDVQKRARHQQRRQRAALEECSHVRSVVLGAEIERVAERDDVVGGGRRRRAVGESRRAGGSARPRSRRTEECCRSRTRRCGGSRTIDSCTGGGRSHAASTRSAKPRVGCGRRPRVEKRRPLAASLAISLIVGSLQRASQRGARARQSRFDGADVDAQRLGDRLVVHVVHFAQQERGAIFGAESAATARAMAAATRRRSLASSVAIGAAMSSACSSNGSE